MFNKMNLNLKDSGIHLEFPAIAPREHKSSVINFSENPACHILQTLLRDNDSKYQVLSIVNFRVLFQYIGLHTCASCATRPITARPSSSDAFCTFKFETI